MNKKIGIFIGRFEPFHNGHMEIIKKSLELVDDLIVFVGSSNHARTSKNPFTFGERKAMIISSFEESVANRLIVLPMEDYYSDKLWSNAVKESVNRVVNGRIVDLFLLGHSKDDTSYYLNIFPNWERIELPNYKGLSATFIRESFYENNGLDISKHVPPIVLYMMNNLKEVPEYERLKEEYVYLKNYDISWKGSPHKPIFTTVDNIVVKADEVLLIRRGGIPNKGLLALPGGFLEYGDTLLKSSIRELKEETTITMSDTEIEGVAQYVRYYDHPNRSVGRRIVTHVFAYDITNVDGVQFVAGDDAASLQFYKVSEVVNYKEQFADDHYQILCNYFGI